jgi:phage-related protein
MTKNWKIIFYETKEGDCPVEKFIDSKSTNNQAKIYAYIDQLEIKGPNLPRPYADILEDGIHELRIKLSGDQVRLLYFFVFKDFIIITNSFIKKTEKVPKSEIKKAKKFRDDYLNRYKKEDLERIYDENI